MSKTKTDYYPTKVTVVSDRPVSELLDWVDEDWESKAELLQARRWQKIHAIEHAQQLEKNYLSRLRQKKWLQRHGWPRVAQPMV